ncbi:HBR364Cp [Eremothecium sinecaudum]|uniref:HBR364Cp n=1 Tax=Eremothecium sinecaudum TaxID=45286 RepID=A0A109UXE9_9SACH|nr:HBR364Cp [Eremothecium sinecaudum]AMD19265.1 HBR364Cp [Eremothecium sinecaudum]
MVDYSNWMREVDPETQLSKLSIAGTHNSAACYKNLPGVRCQDDSVTTQLENGVRFLDVRLGRAFFESNNKDEKGTLQVIHGKFPVKIPMPLKFSKTLEEIYNFLDNHPDETVLLSIKQEGSNDWNNDQDEFGNYVWDNYISCRQDKWYLETTVPKLKDARGKIVLFRRFGVKDEEKKKHYGIEASWWSYNTTNEDRGTFLVQDYCDFTSSEEVAKKAEYAKQLMDNAAQYNSTNTDASKLFLNFLTASNLTSPVCWPERIAQKMSEHNVYNDIKKGCGILIIDFAGNNGFEIPHKVVDCNF